MSLVNAKCVDGRDKRIFSLVAPASGSVVLSALKIFGGFDGSAQDDDPAVNLTTHRRKPLQLIFMDYH